MPNASPRSPACVASASPSPPSIPRRLAFEDFLAKLPAKDRTNVQKRIASAADAPPDGGLLELWRRLACALLTLAPHAAKVVGRQAVQFYIADGKYRMQAFALEDLQDGSLTVYCPDVLSEALTGGVLAAPAGGDAADHYGVCGSAHVLAIASLDRSTIDPPIYYKDMVGWNRRALRITLPAAAAAGQIEAAESLCAIAAHRFGTPAGTVA
jgi:hypothetical protein